MISECVKAGFPGRRGEPAAATGLLRSLHCLALRASPRPAPASLKKRPGFLSTRRGSSAAGHGPTGPACGRPTPLSDRRGAGSWPPARPSGQAPHLYHPRPRSPGRRVAFFPLSPVPFPGPHLASALSPLPRRPLLLTARPGGLRPRPQRALPAPPTRGRPPPWPRPRGAFPGPGPLSRSPGPARVPRVSSPPAPTASGPAPGGASSLARSPGPSPVLPPWPTAAAGGVSPRRKG